MVAMDFANKGSPINMSKKSNKLCESCGGQNLKSHPTTWPVDMGEKTDYRTCVGQGMSGL